ncbi:MAG: ATPase [Leptotrichia sp.]|nr:ATPase [Leptotrichia sp.]
MKSKEVLSAFEKEVKQNKISASYLFYGDKRVDLLFYALEFSKMVMTKDIEDEEEKKSIEKKIENLQHSDIEVINRKNENIKIDEVRELIYDAIESAYSSPKKIFILCGIENLRKESSNALLKILEEPPKDVYFILLARSLNIISTIKSRTIKFHLEGASNEELGVSKEIYYFFDGNENNIKRYKENGIPLEEYEDRINSYEDALSNIKAMKEYAKNEMENNENSSSDASFLEIIINYNRSIEYIVKKIRFFNIEEVYMLVNEIETEFKQERELLGDLLGKIIIAAKRTANGENLKKMINMKNSLRSNVNVRSILFNFFNTLQEIV